MTHHYLEGLNCDWDLVRETPSSSKFIVVHNNTKIAVDVHYTSSLAVTVNLMIEGDDNLMDKWFLNPLMEDLQKIALMHKDYAVIDYTMGATKRLHDGNFSLDDKTREIIRRGAQN